MVYHFPPHKCAHLPITRLCYWFTLTKHYLIVIKRSTFLQQRRDSQNYAWLQMIQWSNTTCDVIVHFFLLEISKTQSCIWAQNFQSKDQANLRRLNGRGAASFENVDEWGSGAHVILSAQCLGRGSWWCRSPSSLGSAAWGEVVVQLTLTITLVKGKTFLFFVSLAIF